MSGVLIKQALQMLLKMTRTSLPRQSSQSPSNPNSETGFTLIELIAVIVIVAVLAAIVGPSWLGFLRQRQATAVRDEIFSILQTAQSEAKQTNLSRTVWFDVVDDTAKFNVYIPEDRTTPPPPLSTDPSLPQLGSDREIESEEIKISIPEDRQSITFDYQGVPDYVTNIDGTTEDIEELSTSNAIFTVTVAPSETETDSQKRCVIIQTLLGGMRTASGIDCEPGS